MLQASTHGEIALTQCQCASGRRGTKGILASEVQFSIILLAFKHLVKLLNVVVLNELDKPWINRWEHGKLLKHMLKAINFMFQSASLNGTFQVSVAGQYCGNHDIKDKIKFRLRFISRQTACKSGCRSR